MGVRQKDKIRLGQLGIFLLILALVEILIRFGLVSGLVLASPSEIALKAWEDVQGGEFWTGFAVTAMEFSLAALISFFIGALFGVLFFRYRILGSAIEPLLLAFYAAPTILLYPVFLTLFGLGSAAIVSMAIIFGSIPIIVNVSVGLTTVEPIFVKLGRSLNVTGAQMFWKIMLPAATPTIFTGLRLGFTYTLVGVIALEFLTFSGGLGRMVSWRYFTFDTSGLFSAIVFIIVIAFVMNNLLGRVENRIRTRWT
jgi:NitT/TauT family transport system permease protein